MSVLALMLLPTWLDFGTKNGEKSEPEAIQKEAQLLIDLLMDLWTVLAPFWVSCWGHLGHLSF